jgi:hypothetical protein
VVGRAGLGAHQHRHQVAARGVRDPGLVAVDAPSAARYGRGARTQRAEVGAGVGLGKDCRGQYAARGNLRQPFGLLRFSAATADKFGGDLRAGAERARGDPRPAQFFGHDAHGALAHAHAAELRGNTHAEYAEFAQLPDDGVRDQFVGQMPGMGFRQDFLFGVTPELVAHEVELFIECRFGQRAPCRKWSTSARRVSGSAARLHQPGHIALTGQRSRGAGKAQFRRPENFTLRHRNAARQLRQVFAGGNRHDQFFTLAQLAEAWPGVRPMRPRRRWPPPSWRSRPTHAARAGAFAARQVPPCPPVRSAAKRPVALLRRTRGQRRRRLSCARSKVFTHSCSFGIKKTCRLWRRGDDTRRRAVSRTRVEDRRQDLRQDLIRVLAQARRAAAGSRLQPLKVAAARARGSGCRSVDRFR